MLYEQKPAEQTCPKSHPPCLLVFHLDALAGSGVTEEKEKIATSGPDEAVRAGGVMEHLIMTLDHFQEAAVDFSILASLQTFQILQNQIHKHNRKAVILTAQCHLISVLEVIQLSYFIFSFQVLPLFSHKRCHHLSLQVLLHHRRLQKCCNSSVLKYNN